MSENSPTREPRSTPDRTTSSNFALVDLADGLSYIAQTQQLPIPHALIVRLRNLDSTIDSLMDSIRSSMTDDNPTDSQLTQNVATLDVIEDLVDLTLQGWDFWIGLLCNHGSDGPSKQRELEEWEVEGLNQAADVVGRVKGNLEFYRELERHWKEEGFEEFSNEEDGALFRRIMREGKKFQMTKLVGFRSALVALSRRQLEKALAEQDTESLDDFDHTVPSTPPTSVDGDSEIGFDPLEVLGDTPEVALAKLRYELYDLERDLLTTLLELKEEIQHKSENIPTNEEDSDARNDELLGLLRMQRLVESHLDHITERHETIKTLQAHFIAKGQPSESHDIVRESPKPAGDPNIGLRGGAGAHEGSGTANAVKSTDGTDHHLEYLESMREGVEATILQLKDELIGLHAQAGKAPSEQERGILAAEETKIAVEILRNERRLDIILQDTNVAAREQEYRKALAERNRVQQRYYEFLGLTPSYPQDATETFKDNSEAPPSIPQHAPIAVHEAQRCQNCSHDHEHAASRIDAESRDQQYRKQKAAIKATIKSKQKEILRERYNAMLAETHPKYHDPARGGNLYTLKLEIEDLEREIEELDRKNGRHVPEEKVRRRGLVGRPGGGPVLRGGGEADEETGLPPSRDQGFQQPRYNHSHFKELFDLLEYRNILESNTITDRLQIELSDVAKYDTQSDEFEHYRSFLKVLDKGLTDNHDFHGSIELWKDQLLDLLKLPAGECILDRFSTKECPQLIADLKDFDDRIDRQEEAAIKDQHDLVINGERIILTTTTSEEGVKVEQSSVDGFVRQKFTRLIAYAERERNLVSRLLRNSLQRTIQWHEDQAEQEEYPGREPVTGRKAIAKKLLAFDDHTREDFAFEIYRWSKMGPDYSTSKEAQIRTTYKHLQYAEWEDRLIDYVIRDLLKYKKKVLDTRQEYLQVLEKEFSKPFGCHQSDADAEGHEKDNIIPEDFKNHDSKFTNGHIEEADADITASYSSDEEIENDKELLRLERRKIKAQNQFIVARDRLSNRWKMAHALSHAFDDHQRQDHEARVIELKKMRNAAERDFDELDTIFERKIEEKLKRERRRRKVKRGLAASLSDIEPSEAISGNGTEGKDWQNVSVPQDLKSNPTSSASPLTDAYLAPAESGETLEVPVVLESDQSIKKSSLWGPDSKSTNEEIASLAEALRTDITHTEDDANIYEATRSNMEERIWRANKLARVLGAPTPFSNSLPHRNALYYDAPVDTYTQAYLPAGFAFRNPDSNSSPMTFTKPAMVFHFPNGATRSQCLKLVRELDMVGDRASMIEGDEAKIHIMRLRTATLRHELLRAIQRDRNIETASWKGGRIQTTTSWDYGARSKTYIISSRNIEFGDSVSLHRLNDATGDGISELNGIMNAPEKHKKFDLPDGRIDNRERDSYTWINPFSNYTTQIPTNFEDRVDTKKVSQAEEPSSSRSFRTLFKSIAGSRAPGYQNYGNKLHSRLPKVSASTKRFGFKSLRGSRKPFILDRSSGSGNQHASAESGSEDQLMNSWPLTGDIANVESNYADGNGAIEKTPVEKTKNDALEDELKAAQEDTKKLKATINQIHGSVQRGFQRMADLQEVQEPPLLSFIGTHEGASQLDSRSPLRGGAFVSPSETAGTTNSGKKAVRDFKTWAGLPSSSTPKSGLSSAEFDSFLFFPSVSTIVALTDPREYFNWEHPFTLSDIRDVLKARQKHGLEDNIVLARIREIFEEREARGVCDPDVSNGRVVLISAPQYAENQKTPYVDESTQMRGDDIRKHLLLAEKGNEKWQSQTLDLINLLRHERGAPELRIREQNSDKESDDERRHKPIGHIINTLEGQCSSENENESITSIGPDHEYIQEQPHNHHVSHHRQQRLSQAEVDDGEPLVEYSQTAHHSSPEIRRYLLPPDTIQEMFPIGRGAPAYNDSEESESSQESFENLARPTCVHCEIFTGPLELYRNGCTICGLPFAEFVPEGFVGTGRHYDFDEYPREFASPLSFPTIPSPTESSQSEGSSPGEGVLSEFYPFRVYANPYAVPPDTSPISEPENGVLTYQQIQGNDENTEPDFVAGQNELDQAVDHFNVSVARLDFLEQRFREQIQLRNRWIANFEDDTFQGSQVQEPVTQYMVPPSSPQQDDMTHQSQRDQSTSSSGAHDECEADHSLPCWVPTRLGTDSPIDSVKADCQRSDRGCRHATVSDACSEDEDATVKENESY